MGLSYRSGAYFDDNNLQYIKRAPIEIVTGDGTGDQELVAAVSGKKIRVLYIMLFSSIASNLTLKSGASTTLVGTLYAPANFGLTEDFPSGICETAAGEALNLNVSVATNVGGIVAYIEV